MGKECSFTRFLWWAATAIALILLFGLSPDVPAVRAQTDATIGAPAVSGISHNSATVTVTVTNPDTTEVFV